MKIAKCDKCKKVNEEKTSLLGRDSRWINGSISGGGMSYYYDLCDECGKNILKYVKKFFGVKKDKK